MVVTFDTEGSRWQVRFEPVQNRATKAKPRWEAWDQDVMVDGVKGSREVEKAKTWYLMSVFYALKHCIDILLLFYVCALCTFYVILCAINDTRSINATYLLTYLLTYNNTSQWQDKSWLSQTNPCNALHHAYFVVHKNGRWIWQTDGDSCQSN